MRHLVVSFVLMLMIAAPLPIYLDSVSLKSVPPLPVHAHPSLARFLGIQDRSNQFNHFNYSSSTGGQFCENCIFHPAEFVVRVYGTGAVNSGDLEIMIITAITIIRIIRIIYAHAHAMPQDESRTVWSRE